MAERPKPAAAPVRRPTPPPAAKGQGKATETPPVATEQQPQVVAPEDSAQPDPVVAEIEQVMAAAPVVGIPDDQDPIRALWYGDPGVGKTTSMLTLANLGPIVVWDAENRLKRSALRRAGVNVDNIERVTEISYTGINAKLDELQTRTDLIGVCFDGATEMTRIMVQHLVDEGVRIAAKKGYERSEWKTYQDDYGDVTEQYRRIMRKAMRLPFHFGMTTLAARNEDTNKAVRIQPQLTPAIARDVNSAMDIVTYVRVDEVGDQILRSGLVAPGSQYDAKDTFGVLPRRLANPTFERIVRYVNEELTRDTDPEQEAAARTVAANTTQEQGA